MTNLQKMIATSASFVTERLIGYKGTYPAEFKTEAETSKALVEFAGPQGKAKHVYSDNNKEIKSACEKLGFPQDGSLPHRPETNGIAENSVKKCREGTSCALNNPD